MCVEVHLGKVSGITHISAYITNLCISHAHQVFMEHLQFEFEKELLWIDLGKYCVSLSCFIRFG